VLAHEHLLQEPSALPLPHLKRRGQLSYGRPASWRAVEQWPDRHRQCRHPQGRHEGRPTGQTRRRWCL